MDQTRSTVNLTDPRSLLNGSGDREQIPVIQQSRLTCGAPPRPGPFDHPRAGRGMASRNQSHRSVCTASRSRVVLGTHVDSVGKMLECRPGSGRRRLLLRPDPGASLARGEPFSDGVSHLHRDGDEVYVVLEGAIDLDVEGSVTTVTAGEAATVGAGVSHALVAVHFPARGLTIRGPAVNDKLVTG